jgi:hypothetical protein
LAAADVEGGKERAACPGKAGKQVLHTVGGGEGRGVFHPGTMNDGGLISSL